MRALNRGTVVRIAALAYGLDIPNSPQRPCYSYQNFTWRLLSKQ